MSCAIEHGKETQKYHLPSKITVSGKRTNLTAGVSGPLLLWGKSCQWYEPQITHHHPLCSLERWAAARRPPNSARPHLYTWFLRKYGDSLRSWSPQNPDFRLLALHQLSNFKELDVSTDLFLRWQQGAWQARLKAQVEDTTLCSAQNQEVPKNWTHRFSIMKETVIQRCYNDELNQLDRSVYRQNWTG